MYPNTTQILACVAPIVADVVGHLAHELGVERLSQQAVRGVAQVTTLLAIVFVDLHAVIVDGHPLDIIADSCGHVIFSFLHWYYSSDRFKKKKERNL